MLRWAHLVIFILSFPIILGRPSDLPRLLEEKNKKKDEDAEDEPGDKGSNEQEKKK